MREAFAAVWKAVPDAQWENGRHPVDGDFGVSEWTFTGTAADGSRIETDGVDLFTFRDGRIRTKNAFRKMRPNLPPATLNPATANDPAMSSTTSARFAAPDLPADKRYDPRYDPLVANDPGSGRAYAPTYWVATAGPAPADDGPVAHDIDADVVVIGSGFDRPVDRAEPGARRTACRRRCSRRTGCSGAAPAAAAARARTPAAG